MEEQRIRKVRNSVADLVSLGICKRGGDSEVLLPRNVKSNTDLEHILALAIGFRDRLGESWKGSSSRRYLIGVLKYKDYSNSYFSSYLKR